MNRILSQGTEVNMTEVGNLILAPGTCPDTATPSEIHLEVET